MVPYEKPFACSDCRNDEQESDSSIPCIDNEGSSMDKGDSKDSFKLYGFDLPGST